ncbi:MAG: sigma-E factor negative regulatory protein [Pseudomonadales bacterium]|nr:sigma-E factor negative regulatory protein [Pseudomonadales bacterium]
MGLDNDKQRESLSALMDNEAGELELRRIIKHMATDDSLLETWRRYHLLSASLKHSAHPRANVNLLPGIQQALANETLPQTKPHPKSSDAPVLGRFWQYLGQGTVAASVALVVLFSAELISKRGDGDLDTRLAENSSNVGINSSANYSSNYSSNYVRQSIPVNTRITSTDQGSSSALDQAARDRLQQAVYRQFEESPLPLEIPVNYSIQTVPGQP